MKPLRPFLFAPFGLPALCLCCLVVAMTILSPVALAAMQRESLKIHRADGEVLVFDVEIARSERQKAQGLMFRRSLARGKGMLFPYQTPAVLTMWMRNTFIPLDMLFIHADGRIHRIEERTEPLSERVISSGAPVNAVLELAGGEAERLGIRPGDRVEHAHFEVATNR